MKSHPTSHTIVVAAVFAACSSHATNAFCTNVGTTTPAATLASFVPRQKKMTTTAVRKSSQENNRLQGDVVASMEAVRSHSYGSFGESVQGGIVSILSLDDVVTSLTNDWESTTAITMDESEHVDDKKGSAVGSDFASLFMPKRPISDLTLGSYIDGIVTKICRFGAFVETDYDIQGGCGRALLHKSQILRKKSGGDWRNALEVGQAIRARVTSVHYEREEIGLSLLSETKTILDLPVGKQVAHATVHSIRPYGVFVDVGCEVQALVHKTRMPFYHKEDKPERWSESVRVGDQVPIRIISCDVQKSRLEASMLSREEDAAVDRGRPQIRALRTATTTTTETTVETNKQSSRKMKTRNKYEKERDEFAKYADIMKELDDALKW